MKNLFNVAAFVQELVLNRTSEHLTMESSVEATLAALEKRLLRKHLEYIADPVVQQRLLSKGINAFLEHYPINLDPMILESLDLAVTVAARQYMRHHPAEAVEALNRYEIMTLTCAYEQGVGWGLDHRGEDRNPYPPQSSGNQAWSLGYQEGERRAKRLDPKLADERTLADIYAFLERMAVHGESNWSLEAQQLLKRVPTNHEEEIKCI